MEHRLGKKEAGKAGKVVKAKSSMALNVMLRSLGVTLKDMSV